MDIGEIVGLLDVAINNYVDSNITEGEREAVIHAYNTLINGYKPKVEGELTVSDIEYKVQERLEKYEREGLNINRYHELLAFQEWLLSGDDDY